MKNQGENKSRNNAFYSREFIYFIADLIGPLSIFHILLSSIYIYIYIYNIYIYYIYVLYAYIYVQKIDR